MVFDGSVSRLTGNHLKRYIEGVSGLPIERQYLLYRDKVVEGHENGRTLGLKDDAQLVLFDQAQKQSRPASSKRSSSREHEKKSSRKREEKSRSRKAESSREVFAEHRSAPMAPEDPVQSTANHYRDPLRHASRCSDSRRSDSPRLMRPQQGQGNVSAIRGEEGSAVPNEEGIAHLTVDELVDLVQKRAQMWATEEQRFYTERDAHWNDLNQQRLSIQFELERVERERSLVRHQLEMAQKKRRDLQQLIAADMHLGMRLEAEESGLAGPSMSREGPSESPAPFSVNLTPVQRTGQS